MILSKEDLLEAVNRIVGDKNDDQTLTDVENIIDTVNASESGEWEKKYRENDEAWRKRYRDRFFGGDPSRETDKETVIAEEKEDIKKDDEKETFEELFEERRK